MDSYGVITIGDHLLSIPGLIIFILLVALGIYLVNKVIGRVPVRYDLFNKLTSWASVIAIVAWTFLLLGLSFYVPA